jgi:hypothetical protein
VDQCKAARARARTPGGMFMAEARHNAFHQLTVGTRVEVRNRFEASFCPGFEISGVDDGYRVRRTSDGVQLPATFGWDEIREAADSNQPRLL